MSRVRLVLVRIFVYLTNNVVAGIPSFRLRSAWYRRMGLSIGKGSGVHSGCYMWFFGPGHVSRSGSSIGDYTRVNRFCCLDLRGGLTIGNNVSISPEVAIITAQHKWREPGFELESRRVVIEDHVWIGIRATLLPGTHVGRGAVIAAGAVVSGDVPELAVVAGNPARVMTTRRESALDYKLTEPFPFLE